MVRLLAHARSTTHTAFFIAAVLVGGLSACSPAGPDAKSALGLKSSGSDPASVGSGATAVTQEAFVQQEIASLAQELNAKEQYKLAPADLELLAAQGLLAEGDAPALKPLAE